MDIKSVDMSIIFRFPQFLIVPLALASPPPETSTNVPHPSRSPLRPSGTSLHP
jgi:hypothetical protein